MDGSAAAGRIHAEVNMQAINDKGEVVEFDGQRWVPVGGADSRKPTPSAGAPRERPRRARTMDAGRSHGPLALLPTEVGP